MSVLYIVFGWMFFEIAIMNLAREVVDYIKMNSEEWHSVENRYWVIIWIPVIAACFAGWQLLVF